MKIETGRCLIRDFVMEDTSELHAVLSDEQVMRYIEAPFGLEQTADFIREAGVCQPPLVHAVVWKETLQVIGHVIFHPYEEDLWEIGWILHRAFWGMGIASELTAALIAQAKTRGAKGCVMECHPAQAATIRIAQKHGFIYVGQNDGCNLYRLTF